MVASAANGFMQLLFQPNATVCTTKAVDFHPTYATSSEKTGNTWTAHSYNIAFSDEIGHYEYCNQTDGAGAPTPSAMCSATAPKTVCTI